MTRKISLSGQMISRPAPVTIGGSLTKEAAQGLEFYFAFGSPVGEQEGVDNGDIKVTVIGKPYERLMSWNILNVWDQFNADPENPRPIYLYLEGYLFTEKVDENDKFGTLTIRAERIEKYSGFPTINRVVFAGRIAKDAERKEGKGDKLPPAKMRVADGSKEYAVFIDVDIWGKRADTTMQHKLGTKGTVCCVVGALRKELYEHEGKEIERFSISTNDVEYFGKGEGNGNGSRLPETPKTAQTKVVQPADIGWDSATATGWGTPVTNGSDNVPTGWN